MARLLLGAVQKDVAEGDEVRDEGVGVGGVHPGQLLEHHGAGLVGEAHAAELLGDLHHVQPQIEAPLVQLAGALPRLVGGGHVRHDLVAGDVAHELHQLALLLGVSDGHRFPLYSSPAGRLHSASIAYPAARRRA